MSIFDSIEKPTLLLDEATAHANLRRMAQKAHAAGVRFRPHFKTHQSREIAGWFREAGVQAATVSSLDMAEYFAADGWNDLTLAVTANLRQAAGLERLARRVHLGLLVEAEQAVHALGHDITAPIDLWIKVDVGAHRTGLAWDDLPAATRLVEAIQAHPQFHLAGLLTHAGHTYSAASPAEALARFQEGTTRLDQLRQALQRNGSGPLQVSVGDTPGCSAATQFAPADEIRPGNFIFFDAEQALMGSCTWPDVAVALACPVLAVHPERNEAVVYGGAIHLSKDTYNDHGRLVHGWVALPEGSRWGLPLTGAWVDRLSQEHGVLHLAPAHLARLHPGDLVCLLPAHSCLTAQCMGRYRSLEGRWIEMMPNR
jgi:D-serine deaminase-like pyridoxal phosphate-dependent protein